MQTKINKEWVKNSRYIGKENFDYGIRLDVDFDTIINTISNFGGVIVRSSDQYNIFR